MAELDVAAGGAPRLPDVANPDAEGDGDFLRRPATSGGDDSRVAVGLRLRRGRCDGGSPSDVRDERQTLDVVDGAVPARGVLDLRRIADSRRP